jgi:O-antigen/teichoic acid export membrane protein
MKINKNMGSIDRIIRVLLAAIVFVLIFTNVLSGTLAWVLGILAGIFLLTSFVSFCPLYVPFKFSTKKE